MKQENKIQSYYKKMFLRLVSIPLILVFVISMVLVLIQAQDDQKEELDIASHTVVELLEKEISETSVGLSHFILTDNSRILRLSKEFNDAEYKDKYGYWQEMTRLYDMCFVRTASIIAIDFYCENGAQYGFEHDHILSSDEANSGLWYQDAKNHPDVVRVNIADIDDIRGRQYLIEDKKLLMLSLSVNKINSFTDVDMINMCVYSETLNNIKDAEFWSHNMQVYLLNKNGEIIVSSGADYKSDIQEIHQTGNSSNTGIRFSKDTLPRTGWTVVAIGDRNASTKAYSYIIWMIIILVSSLFLLLYLFMNRLLTNMVEPINKLSDKMKKVSQDSKLEKCEVNGIYEMELIQTTYNGMIDEIDNLIEQNRKREVEKHEEEMKVLELQLNPHFLSNTLSSIRFMSIVAKFESIQKMTESLMNILDVSFRNSDSFHSLQEELVLLESYVYIMTIRYANNFEVYYEIDEAIECKHCPVPKLIMQPFLENAITHGVQSLEKIGQIWVQICSVDNEIEVRIRDNGCGIELGQIQNILAKEPVNGSKIGIANINKRLKLYYGEEYSIKIKSELNQYTEVFFRIPYAKI